MTEYDINITYFKLMNENAVSEMKNSFLSSWTGQQNQNAVKILAYSRIKMQ